MNLFAKIHFILIAFFILSCGESTQFVQPSQEDKSVWEGIGLVGDSSDTVSMSDISGKEIARPNTGIIIGPVSWQVESVEELLSGVANTWPSRNEKWILLRMRIENDEFRRLRLLNSDTRADKDTFAHRDTAVPASILEPITRTLILRENIVLLDDKGNRHLPIKIHDRIEPLIDKPMKLDSEPLDVVLIFGVNRDDIPTGIEIHYPLGNGKVEWISPAEPSQWNLLNKKVLFTDKSMNVMWEVTVEKTNISSSETGSNFLAKAVFINVTRETASIPNPSSMRLYTGSGKTLYSVSLPLTRIVEPGKAVRVEVRFVEVPRLESIELIVPYRDEILRVDMQNGFPAEKPFPMKQPVFSDGVRATVYSAARRNEFRLRVGLTNFGSENINISGMRVKGYSRGTWVSGLVEDAPNILHSGFEERRWFSFSEPITSIKLEAPGRRAITISL